MWLVLLSFILSSIAPFSSQNGVGDNLFDDTKNISDVVASCPANASCEDLPARCIECDFNEDCAYGNDTEVMCMPKDVIECTVSHGCHLQGWTCRYFTIPSHPHHSVSTLCQVMGLTLFIFNSVRMES